MADEAGLAPDLSTAARAANVNRRVEVRQKKAALLAARGKLRRKRAQILAQKKKAKEKHALHRFFISVRDFAADGCRPLSVVLDSKYPDVPRADEELPSDEEMINEELHCLFGNYCIY